MRVLFEVEFDSAAWERMGAGEQCDWMDVVTDAINDHARVVGETVCEEV